MCIVAWILIFVFMLAIVLLWWNVLRKPKKGWSEILASNEVSGSEGRCLSYGSVHPEAERECQRIMHPSRQDNFITRDPTRNLPWWME